jgi:hypothetical protein
MNDTLIIVIISVAVVAIGACLILAKASARRERAWLEVIRRKDAELARSELFRKEAEQRWGELVETVSSRTDQAKAHQ